MFENLSQYQSIGFWIMQAVVGVVFIVHSWGKIKNPAGIAAAYHAPKVVGLLHGLVELVGGALLILDIQAQLVAIIFGLIMLGAIYFKIFKWKVAFYSHTGSGWELDLLILGICITIVTV